MSDVFSPMKLDFSSFYKFVSSVGLLLISASVALPWFALRASVPVAQDESTAAATVDTALNARANQYLFIVSAYPWVSLFLFTLGCVLTGYGLFAWRNRQKKQDADEDESFRQRIELGQTVVASEEDREEKLDEEANKDGARRETAATIDSVNGEHTRVPKTSKRAPKNPADQRYLARRELIKQTEQQIEQLLDTGFSETHSIESGVRLSGPNSPILDLVARAKDADRWTSFAFEVRLVDRSTFLLRTVRDTMVSVAIAARDVPEGQIQVNRVGRPPIAKSVSLCFFVIPDDNQGGSGVSKLPMSAFKQRIATMVDSTNAVLLRKAGVIVVSQNDLKHLSPAWLHDTTIATMLRPEEIVMSPYIENSTD